MVAVAVAVAAVAAVVVAVAVALAVRVVRVAVVVAVAVALLHWQSSLPCARMTLAAARMIAPQHCQLPPACAMMMRRLSIVGRPLLVRG